MLQNIASYARGINQKMLISDKFISPESEKRKKFWKELVQEVEPNKEVIK